MSWLSKGLSNIADNAKNVVHQPLKVLANAATLGQMSNIKNALKSRNGATLLGTAVMPGIGTAIGAAKDQNDIMQQNKQNYLNEQNTKKNDANTNLNNTLNGITGGTNPNVDPYLNPSQSNNGQAGFEPWMNQPQQLPHGSLPFDSLSPDIQQTLAAQSPALQQRLQQIVGPGNGQAQQNAGQLLNANDLATQLSQQTLDKQTEARKQQIADMSTLLTNQAKTQYERSLPSLYEDLNTRGLLRSSDLGNQMATKEQQSFQDVANQLGQQQLGYNDQYINGMGNITNQYNSGVGSALQREFSLQDYANQVKASQQLGQAVAPMQPYGGKTAGTAVSNVVGGAATGAKLAGK